MNAKTLDNSRSAQAFAVGFAMPVRSVYQIEE